MSQVRESVVVGGRGGGRVWFGGRKGGEGECDSVGRKGGEGECEFVGEER